MFLVEDCGGLKRVALEGLGEFNAESNGVQRRTHNKLSKTLKKTFKLSAIKIKQMIFFSAILHLEPFETV